MRTESELTPSLATILWLTATVEVVPDIPRGARKSHRRRQSQNDNGQQTIHAISRKMKFPCLPNHHPPKDLDLATP